VPNETYEAAARHFTMSLVADNALPELLNDIVAFDAHISAPGAVNGLAQVLLKLTVPGVPDFYQGTEFWDFSLVDPDNRRPVDFAPRIAGLNRTPLEALVPQWRDGRIKQALIARTLALRRVFPALFAGGGYEPLDVRGAFPDRVVAFARRFNEELVAVIIPRLASRFLASEDSILFDQAAWRDTVVMLDGHGLGNQFGASPPMGEAIEVGPLLSRFPVSLLVSSRIEDALRAQSDAAAHTTLR
jgi:maltooligosyltrehalose synthase